ncbi:hypothetical protein OROMI_002364 [Orobanche minor]
MTILRSRKILATVPSKTSKPLAPENAVGEQVTPPKAFEFMNQPSTSSGTPSSASQAQELGLGSRDTMLSETGTVRRRSARLVRKLDTGGYVETVEVVSGKRKKVGGHSLNSKSNARNLETQALDLNSGDGGVTESVRAMEEVKKGENFAASGLVGTVSGGGRHKRKLSAKSLGFESDEKEKVQKKSTSLRSGKRVVRIEMEDKGGSAGNWLEEIGNSKQSGFLCYDDDLVGTMSRASVEEGEISPVKEKRVSRGDKGKGKVGRETLEMSGSLSVKSELDDQVGLSPSDSCHDAFNLPESADINEAVKDKGRITIETGVKTRGRLSKEEKGKMILEVNTSSSFFSGTSTAEVKIENVHETSVSGANNHSAANEALPVEQSQVRETNVAVNNSGSAHRERFRNFARQNASRFAHFSSQEEDGSRALPEAQNGVEDWPGPFSTAMKIVRDRGTNKSGVRSGASTDKSETVELKWVPRKQDKVKCEKQVPHLQELCLSILSKNVDAVTSLDFVPDVLRHKITCFLCDSRRMNSKFLELLVHGSPTEIRIRDCSWLTEELFTKVFEGVDASQLTVLQFDQCGSCMPDYTLCAALARSPNCLPALTSISLKGAYRLTDAGVSVLASAAPSLKSIDISQCPLLTSEGVCCLLNSLKSVIRELYLDNSHGINAMIVLPALLKLESLEVLSLAGIQTVCDDFVSKFISVNGSRLKELILANCLELTDLSFEVIGDNCSELLAVDLTNLCKLTDVSIGHLANGCRAIETLKVCRNAFSAILFHSFRRGLDDEAIAAYLDVRGASIKDLSLNNIIQVSNHTALSLARNCRKLRFLDLSWCRKLTNEALGLIVDSCSLLEVLKLFGCTQVTNVFLDGHSNPQVKLIGLKMTLIMKNIDVPDILQGPLRYSSSFSP